jgi:hypothetical protein
MILFMVAHITTPYALVRRELQYCDTSFTLVSLWLTTPAIAFVRSALILWTFCYTADFLVSIEYPF